MAITEDQVNQTYTAQGWLGGLTFTPHTQSAQNVLASLSYTGLGGAMGSPTAGNIGPGSGVYQFSVGYDNNARANSLSLTNMGGTVTKFSQSRTFDAVGNVTSTNTMLPSISGSGCLVHLLTSHQGLPIGVHEQGAEDPLAALRGSQAKADVVLAGLQSTRSPACRWPMAHQSG